MTATRFTVDRYSALIDVFDDKVRFHNGLSGPALGYTWAEGHGGQDAKLRDKPDDRRPGTRENPSQLRPGQVEGNREHQETDHDPNDQADSWIEVERRLIDGFQSDPP